MQPEKQSEQGQLDQDFAPGDTAETVTDKPNSAGRQPRPGDILLFHRATGLNRVITWFTRSPYYHAAIYAGDFHVVEARPRGVIRRDLHSREGGHHYVVVPAPPDKGEVALRWAEAQIGDKYDHIDVVVIVLERVFRHLHINYTPRDRFSCGEFVAMAFVEAGAPLLPDCPPAATVPGDFARLLDPQLQKN